MGYHPSMADDLDEEFESWLLWGDEGHPEDALDHSPGQGAAAFEAALERSRAHPGECLPDEREHEVVIHVVGTDSTLTWQSVPVDVPLTCVLAELSNDEVVAFAMPIGLAEPLPEILEDPPAYRLSRRERFARWRAGRLWYPRRRQGPAPRHLRPGRFS